MAAELLNNAMRLETMLNRAEVGLTKVKELLDHLEQFSAGADSTGDSVRDISVMVAALIQLLGTNQLEAQRTLLRTFDQRASSLVHGVEKLHLNFQSWNQLSLKVVNTFLQISRRCSMLSSRLDEALTQLRAFSPIPTQNQAEAVFVAKHFPEEDDEGMSYYSMLDFGVLF